MAPPQEVVRVLLVEDHASLRDALAAVIGMTDGMEVVAALGRADDDTLDDDALHVDVAVVDLDLPGGSGVEVVERLRARDAPVGCVVLTGLVDDRELGRAIESGASAVLHKSTPMPDLLDAVRTVAGGGTVLPPADTSRRLRALAEDREQRWEGRLLAEQLTRREREVLELLVWGRGNDDIAEALVISPDTVQTHVKNLMAKLAAGSRLEAVSRALRLGLVAPPEGKPPTGG